MYQVNALVSSINKIKYWLIIHIVLLFTSYFIILGNPIRINRNSMLDLLGIVDKKFYIPNILFLLFQIFITIYFIHLLFNFEKNNSPEFTYMRISKRLLIRKKILLSVISLSIFRLFYYFLVYALFKFYLSFNFFDLLLSVLEYLFLVLVYIIIFKLVKKYE